eukprot:g5672.t1
MTRTPFFSRFSSKQERAKRGLATPAPSRWGFGSGRSPGGTPRSLERNQLRVRWLVLVLTCTLMIGNYYCYDNPSALKEQLYERFAGSMSRSEYEAKFSLLYSLYSFPNVVLPFFGGLLVDRFSARAALLLFGGLITLGQCLLALGCSLRSFPLMLVGRVVFGFGGESLTVAQSAIVSLWFKGRELAMALGINLSIARLGGTINNQLSPLFARSQGITFSLWFGVLMCCVSLAATLMLIPIDVRATRRLRQQRVGRAGRPGPCCGLTETDDGSGAGAGESEAVSISDVKHFGKLLWLLTASCVVVYGCVLPFNNTASSFLLERDLFRQPPPLQRFPALVQGGAAGAYAFECPARAGAGAGAGAGGCCCCADAANLGTCFTQAALPAGTLAAGACAAGDDVATVCASAPPYAPVLPAAFAAIIDCGASDTTSASSTATQEGGPYGLDYLNGKGNPHAGLWWNTSVPVWTAAAKVYCDAKSSAESKAALIMSIPYFISACISPFLGFAVDRVGKRAVIATAAPALLLLVHMLLALASPSAVPAEFPLIGQGLAYSMFAAALWPSVPYVVADKFVGTAYGLITAVQNFGLAVFPLVIAAIYSAGGNKYVPNVEYFFVALAAVGVCIGVMLNVQDPKYGSPMNSVHRDEDADEGDSGERGEGAGAAAGAGGAGADGGKGEERAVAVRTTRRASAGADGDDATQSLLDNQHAV